MEKPRDAFTTDDVPPAVAVSPFAPGTVIAGRYRIDRRLGAGGGGTVWRCTDQKLDAVVALKIVSSDGDLERWRREVAMARRIADRNVCRVHDLGETAELRFVTMELVEGTSLRSSIRPDLPADQARSLIAQIVSGVSAIHAAGVVHRDLKPENVVVATDGRAVIVDFGLAREPATPQSSVVHEGRARVPSDAVTKVVSGTDPTQKPGVTVTNAGVVVGTPRYMSPEQAAGDTVDARTDVWALGLIAHELLAGTLPEPHPDGRKVADSVDDKWPGTKRILQRCLALTPEQRYLDASELKRALVPRKRRWPWLLAGLAVAGLAVAAGVMFGGTREATPAPPAPTPTQPGPYRMLQLTTTEAGDWPRDAPASVAMSPDGKRFAYSTGDPKLYVRDLAGGTKVDWEMPKLIRPITATVIGWFGDGSLGIVGTTYDGYHLLRVHGDGRSEHLYTNRQRFRAAVTARGDRVAIAIDGDALYVLGPGTATPTRITELGRDDQVIGLAWALDGAKLAVARLPGQHEEATIHTLDASIDKQGAQLVEVWRGRSLAIVDPLLAWVAADRLAFSYQDPDTRVTSLLAIDTTTKDVAVREQFPTDYLGLGGAANGTVLLLRGTAGYSVQVRNKFGHARGRAHPTTTEGSRVAGWTTDGKLVFLEGPPAKAQIVLATASEKLSQPWTTTPWPKTTPGVDVPDLVMGESLVSHHIDPTDARFVIIEKISPSGDREQLARIDNDGLDNPVLCAGDRAPPCLLEQLDGTHVTWTELDLDHRGASMGKLVYRRPLRARHMRGAALSHDGALLGIVEGGNEVVLVDVATKTVLPKPPALGAGTALYSIGFVDSGDIWVTATSLQGRLFALARLRRTDRGYPVSNVAGEPLRWYSGPRTNIGEDGSIGVTVRDFHFEIWRADGI